MVVYLKIFNFFFIYDLCFVNFRNQLLKNVCLCWNNIFILEYFRVCSFQLSDGNNLELFWFCFVVYCIWF